MLIDILIDTAIDTIKTIPFLYLTYLLMEYIEDRTQNGSILLLKKHPSIGPVVGSAAGVIPQCGFSAAAASLYAGGIISAGSLIAIYSYLHRMRCYLFCCQKGCSNNYIKNIRLKVLDRSDNRTDHRHDDQNIQVSCQA